MTVGCFFEFLYFCWGRNPNLHLKKIRFKSPKGKSSLTTLNAFFFAYFFPLGLFGVSENWTFPDTLRVRSAHPSENPFSAKEKSKLGKYAQPTLVFVLFIHVSESAA